MSCIVPDPDNVRLTQEAIEKPKSTATTSLFCPLSTVAVIAAACAVVLLPAHPGELIDHHQHLISPQALTVFSPGKPITAAVLIAHMEAAGIDRAVVLSDAYAFSNPFKSPGPEEYSRVRPENDWVSGQVAQYPRRLIGFCAVNLRDYAVREIERCSKMPPSGPASNFTSATPM